MCTLKSFSFWIKHKRFFDEDGLKCFHLNSSETSISEKIDWERIFAKTKPFKSKHDADIESLPQDKTSIIKKNKLFLQDNETDVAGEGEEEDEILSEEKEQVEDSSAAQKVSNRNDNSHPLKDQKLLRCEKIFIQINRIYTLA